MGLRPYYEWKDAIKASISIGRSIIKDRCIMAIQGSFGDHPNDSGRFVM